MASPKICSIPDCGKVAIKRDWCSAHYQRWRTYGDPNHPVRTPPGMIKKWMHDHLTYGGDECLLWPFAKDSNGVSHMNYGDGKFGTATRFMCIQVHGEPPSIYHTAALTCGDASNGCVHPKHVFWEPPTPWLAEPKVVGFEVCCGVEDCTEPHYRLGVCHSHYKRNYRYGDVLGGDTPKNAIPEWLRNHVDHRGDDCLLWPFYRDTRGYAFCDKDLGSGVASNVMCRMAHGDPPTSKHQAAHNCGKGHEGCVNPKHLRWALPIENSADQIVHGTRVRGEKSWKAKLTEQQVRDIRASTLQRSRLAIAYSVSESAIYNVQKRINWAWLE